MDIRGISGDISVNNLGALQQAGDAAAVEKKKEKIRKDLKDLTDREARKRLEKEYGRDIEDPGEKEIVEKLAEEIRKNAEKFI
jgi:hypothetical protein